MFIKHFFLHYVLENIYFLISLTGFFKTSIGIKFYQYIYEKYKKLAERKTLLQIASYIKTGSLAIDVGASIGVYTEVFSNAVGHEGRVVAIEPDPININALASKFQNSESNVSIIKAAALDKNKKLFLVQNRFSPAGRYISNKGLPIQSVTVDELTSNIEIPVSLIKIDVEGAEGLVVYGGKKTIKKYRPVILVEYTPERLYNFGVNPIELLSFLEKSGYFFSILGNKPKVKMLTIDKIYKFAKAKFTIDLLCLPNSIERENSNSIQNHNNYLK